jgi:hypothetical protein
MSQSPKNGYFELKSINKIRSQIVEVELKNIMIATFYVKRELFLRFLAHFLDKITDIFYQNSYVLILCSYNFVSWKTD